VIDDHNREALDVEIDFFKPLARVIWELKYLNHMAFMRVTSSHEVDKSESENPAGLTSSHEVDRSESENPAGLR
jgi:hypothetical protein